MLSTSIKIHQVSLPDEGSFEIPFSKLGGELRVSMWEIDYRLYIYLLSIKEMKVSTPYDCVEHSLHSLHSLLKRTVNYKVNRDTLTSIYDTPLDFYSEETGKARMVSYLYWLLNNQC